MTDQQPVLEPPERSTSMPVVVPRKSNRSSNLLLALAGIIAVAGIAFAGGRLTAPAASAAGNNGGFNGFPGGSFNPGQFPGGGQSVGGGGLGQALGGGGLRGEVTAVTDTSITIQLENGSAVTVPVDASTDYQAATETTASGVLVGSDVVVQSEVSVNPGASPGTTLDPTTDQPNLNFGPAQQVIVLDN